MAGKSGMDLKQVKELVELMKDNDLVEIELVSGDNRIHLKRPQPPAPVLTQVPMPMASMPMTAPAGAPVGPAPAAETVAARTEEIDKNIAEITSPIIGTFYSAPSPDSDPYVSVGDVVKPDTVVCIVEAMKVMNEIKAEVSGTVVEVLCKAGQAVEFGQPLFRVKTA